MGLEGEADSPVSRIESPQTVITRQDLQAFGLANGFQGGETAGAAVLRCCGAVRSRRRRRGLTKRGS